MIAGLGGKSSRRCRLTACRDSDGGGHSRSSIAGIHCKSSQHLHNGSVRSTTRLTIIRYGSNPSSKHCHSDDNKLETVHVERKGC